MDHEKVHQGKNRQDISPDEADAAGRGAGINPDLHAADYVTNVADQPERNLHGDVPGSAYAPPDSAPDAADTSQGTPRSDDAATRKREVESRVTGESTEALAAEDEAEGNDSKPKPNRPAKK